MMELRLNKSLIYFMTALALGAVSQLANAEEGLRIGFVNIPKILDGAPQAKDADSRLKQEFTNRESKVGKAKEELRRLEEKLRKEEETMSQAEANKLTQDIRTKRRDLERELDVFREDFSIRRSDEINKLQKDILNAINALAKEEGYDLVVGEGVVYANSRVDITDKILGRLQGGE